MHEGIAQLAELYPSCFRRPRQPLKIGIHNDIIIRHPELRPSLIASALKTYTRSLGYLETLKTDAARIDLEGNPVGTVTAADEEDAKRKIAKAPRRRPLVLSGAFLNRFGRGLARLLAVLERLSRGAEPPLGLAGLKAAAQARRVRLLAAK
jgi:hypothetical protein